MARKRKTNIYKPNGYPYVLFDVGSQFVVAVSEDQAKEQMNPRRKKSPEPVHIKSLTDKLGHNKAHDFLTKFGSQWMCKDGIVFYPAR